MIEIIAYDDAAPPFEMQRIELTARGFDVHFTQPLAKGEIPVEQVVVRRFGYLYWAEYGSDRQNNIPLPVQTLSVSADRRTLSIAIPVNRAHVYEIDVGNVRSADGLELQNHFAFYTLNELVE